MGYSEARVVYRLMFFILIFYPNSATFPNPIPSSNRYPTPHPTPAPNLQLVLSPRANWNGEGRVIFTVSAVGSSSGSDLSYTQVLAVRVLPVADRPKITAPARVTAESGKPAKLGLLSISNPDALYPLQVAQSPCSSYPLT